MIMYCRSRGYGSLSMVGRVVSSIQGGLRLIISKLQGPEHKTVDVDLADRLGTPVRMAVAT